MIKDNSKAAEELRKIRNRIDWFCENKVNSFSATISPAPKSVERGEIESILEAVRYYVKNGITELVIQKKYMGSYCDIYLHKELDDTYFVSRNGHRIEHIDLQAAKAACLELHSRFNWDGLQIVIVQAELMPWSILGKGLISNEFEGYVNAHENHFSFLKHSSIYDKIELLKSDGKYQEFEANKQQLTPKELKQKYAAHIIRQYTALEQFAILDLNSYGDGISIYKDQIAHFGKEGELHFKPFNVLKRIFADGTEEIPNDNLSYAKVSSDEFIELNIAAEAEIENAVLPVYNWMKELENNNEEGIVIKPRKAFQKNIPPAFKVRNNHYLTMIYGVHFLRELAANINKRNIGRKLECSINDWEINYRLLKVPYSEIGKENYYLKNLVYDRIMGERVEATLDIRL